MAVIISDIFLQTFGPAQEATSRDLVHISSLQQLCRPRRFHYPSQTQPSIDFVVDFVSFPYHNFVVFCVSTMHRYREKIRYIFKSRESPCPRVLLRVLLVSEIFPPSKLSLSIAILRR